MAKTKNKVWKWIAAGGVLLLATGSATASAVGRISIDKVLKTIRTKESNGNYSAHNYWSSASGAYQFVDGTWNNYGGYLHAYQAPASIQDAKAKEEVQRILSVNGNQLKYVPAVWYVGDYGAANYNWNTIPFASSGNTLTINQYVDAWLQVYNSI